MGQGQTAEQNKSQLNLSSMCIDMGRTIDSRLNADEAIKLLKNDNIRNGNVFNYKFKLGKAYYIKYKACSKEQKLDAAKKGLQEAVVYTPDDESIRKA